MRKARLDRGLWQKDVARLLGCTPDTVKNYETGRTSPDLRHWPAILRFLGYDPRQMPTSWPERLRHVREGRGLTQEEVAVLLGVDIRTANAWENGRNRPRLAGRVAGAVKNFLGER